MHCSSTEYSAEQETCNFYSDVNANTNANTDANANANTNANAALMTNLSYFNDWPVFQLPEFGPKVVIIGFLMFSCDQI